MSSSFAPNASITEGVAATDIGDTGANGFLIDLIAQGNSGLALGDDGFYFQVSDKTGEDSLLKTLDAIADGGFLIKDFQYGHVLDFVIENRDFPDGMIRLGNSLAPLDPAKFESFEKALIRDDAEAYFEFTPGAPLPGGCDEFLALLWKHGVKFGVDIASLEAMLVAGVAKPGKHLVARSIPAIEGIDAKPVPKVNFQRQRTIKEAGTSGLADLHFYECGFPQVPTGPGPHTLLEKRKAAPGRTGRTIDGRRLEPKPVKDFDLAKMAGTGTRVMEINGNPAVITDNGGYFIDVDPKQQISVSPYAKNSFPIGPKTGSFEVTGDRFEQCSDIEHQYLLIGRHIDIKPGSVRGKVISRSGNVFVGGEIENGGQVEAEGGDVTVKGAVLGGRIVALVGKISVTRAEGSVLIAHEVEVEESAINCFVIADIIRVGKAAGIGFYGQNVTIGQLDFTQSNTNPVAGYLVLHDNLNARKAIRRFEKRQRRLEKVSQIEILVREQGLSDAWAALDTRMSGGEPLSPDEAQMFGPLLKPYDYVKRRRGMVSKDREFFDNPQNVQKHQAAQMAVEDFEVRMKASVGLSIQNIIYPADLMELITGADDAESATAFNAIPQAFYAYVSSDPSIVELAKFEKKLQNSFLAFVSRMLAGTVINEARIRPLRNLALLKSPCVLDYASLKACANADNPGHTGEERRNDSARIEIRKNVVIPVIVDGYSVGRLSNVSDHGASVIFDDMQDNPPVFERLEEVQMTIQPGHIVETRGGAATQSPLKVWAEQRYPFSIAAVVENDSAGLVRIRGYYAHMNEDAFNQARRLRTQIEALMMQLTKS